MALEMPPGLDAFYVELGWEPGDVLCVHRDDHVPQGQRDYELLASRAESVCYALNQMPSLNDKAALFRRMTESGVVKVVP